MSASHGLRFDGSRFWVMHRQQEYGPFDYQWSTDLRGLEMIYQGEKFGEHCSENQIYADLKEFHLPQSVVAVGSIVLGCTLYGIVNSLCDEERREFMVQRLREHGYEKFAESCHGSDAV
jgi:hypothetical protein